MRYCVCVCTCAHLCVYVWPYAFIYVIMLIRDIITHSCYYSLYNVINSYISKIIIAILACEDLKMRPLLIDLEWISKARTWDNNTVFNIYTDFLTSHDFLYTIISLNVYTFEFLTCTLFTNKSSLHKYVPTQVYHKLVHETTL